jgi:uncharacterized protein
MKCPICKKDVVEPKAGEPAGTFPFCSERCKLVDLGRWLGGKYQIAATDPDQEGRDVDSAGGVAPNEEEDD